MTVQGQGLVEIDLKKVAECKFANFREPMTEFVELLSMRVQVSVSELNSVIVLSFVTPQPAVVQGNFWIWWASKCDYQST